MVPPTLRVLLIDDSETFRDRMRRRLEEEPGIIVVEARDGFEGLIAIEQSHPDVVLLDLHMPGIDGFTVLAEIRARAAAPHVIVLTAHLTPEVRKRCERAGVDALVDKSDAATAIVPLVRGLPAVAAKDA